jgi:two-component system sensor histidine kinase HupT/HoxJ
VFDPFYTTKAVGKGTGLGLYISYNLAVEQGGELQATNHPQGGAIFSLKLPNLLNGI